MTREELRSLREKLGLSQAQMAERIGIRLRAYSDLENLNRAVRDVSGLAAERVALAVAAERGDPMLAPASVRRDALALIQALKED